MIKKRIVFLVFFVVGIVTMSFAQEGSKSVRIKQMKNNTGERWAICIGINDYEDRTIIDLKKARNDAKELGKVLKEYGQFDRVYVMTDDLNPRNEDYPKLMNIRRKLDFLKGFIDPEDLVLFSFSGHGIANSKGEGFLVTVDSYRDDFQGSSLKVKEIIEWLKKVNVKKSLLLLDACREQFQEGKATNLNGLKVERFLQAEVGAVFYSTKSGWFSYEDKEGDFGVFTKYVIDGLKGEADSNESTGNGDGIVTFFELEAYVQAGVSSWALNQSKKQKPYTSILGEKYGDLALSAYVKTGNQEKKKPEISEDKPANVNAIESRGIPVNKNDKGYWEADYGDGIVMIYIPSGYTIMGKIDKDDLLHSKDSYPPKQVHLDGYWIGKTEVTVQQFRAFVKSRNYVTNSEIEGDTDMYDDVSGELKKDLNWRNPGFKQANNHPVVFVSWDDANAYCEWMSEKTRLTFKLPTEAQWEKAARGPNNFKYPWDNHEPHYNGKWYANCMYEKRSDYGGSLKKVRDADGFVYTSPVGHYIHGASPYGLLDMAGNVMEWCYDWYGSSYAELQKNPKGPSTGRLRVIRGGSWNEVSNGLYCYIRYGKKPTDLSNDLGFRLCQDDIK